MPASQGPGVTPKSNFDLMLEHLADSFAAALVRAHINRETTSSISAIRQMVEDRLAMLKTAYVEHPDQ